jgi:uncharacterized protein (TIGR02284 family)
LLDPSSGFFSFRPPSLPASQDFPGFYGPPLTTLAQEVLCSWSEEQEAPDSRASRYKAMSTDEPVSVLRELAAVCRQDERGFSGAADAVSRKEVREALRRYGLQRSRLAAELEQHIARLNGDGQPAAVRLFGAWAALSAAAHRDESAVLAECARSEAITRQRFEWALERDLPLNVRMVVHRQYTDIKAALQWLGRAQTAASQRKHSLHEA